MTEVVIGVPPAAVTVSDLQSYDPYEGLKVRVTAALRGLTLAKDVTIQRPVVDFWDGLAAEWKGWPGKREYFGPAEQLTFICRHDGVGHVETIVTVGEGRIGPEGPGTWGASLVVDVEPGALAGIAAGLREMFDEAVTVQKLRKI